MPLTRIQYPGMLLALALAGCASLRQREPSAPFFGGRTGYPGTPPGRAAIVLHDRQITLSNSALSMSWRWTDEGFRLQSVRDAQLKQSLTLTGELFQIVLADGRRYEASTMKPEGQPRIVRLRPQHRASRLAERISGERVELPLRSADGQLRVVWRSLVHDQANYVRQEIDITSEQRDCVIQEVMWLDERILNARAAGQVDGAPAVAGQFFFGAEDPNALNHVQPLRQEASSNVDLPSYEPTASPLPGGELETRARNKAPLLGGAGGGFSGPKRETFSRSSHPNGRVSCRVRRNAVLRQGETLTQSFVWGVAPPGQMRRAFLYYLERERAHPYRSFLHYNSWYDIAWSPFALNETNCLEAIRLLGERFIKPHSVVMDAMVFDDGWDDPRTLWQFHSGFPRGFAPLAELAKKYHTRLGVWLSPFGGYGEPKKERLKFGREQGYEINQTGFSLAGAKYHSAFKQSCVDMIRNYRVNHFKFDGIAAGTYAQGSAEYLLDTEAMRRLMLELRHEDSNLFINLTTGSWPSPFWLRFADSLWRQGGDMGFAGPGSKQQQWLTYRDREVYRNIVRKSPLYPLNSLMTQGVAYSRHGSAGEPSFNSAGFKDDVRAFFGGGTGLQELYIQPAKLTAADWVVLAEAAKWSRAHADVLVDTHWIGGDPGILEVYGYASWSPRMGIVMLRNPDQRPREFALDVGAAFELPPEAATRYALQSPWAEDAGQPVLIAEVGQPLQLNLKPFEVIVLNATATLPKLAPRAANSTTHKKPRSVWNAADSSPLRMGVRRPRPEAGWAFAGREKAAINRTHSKR
ncbi:MAG: enterotoxin [Verrucomicrobia bacterium]|nr:enterotoxin [Verrucomicrobiota bacterium]